MPRKVVSETEHHKKTASKKVTKKKTTAKKKTVSKKTKSVIKKKTTSKKPIAKSTKSKKESSKKITKKKITSKKTSSKKITSTKKKPVSRKRVNKKSTLKKGRNEVPLSMKIFTEKSNKEIDVQTAFSETYKKDIMLDKKELDQPVFLKIFMDDSVDEKPDKNFEFSDKEFDRAFPEDSVIEDDTEQFTASKEEVNSISINSEQSISGTNKNGNVFRNNYNRITTNVLGTICLLVMFTVALTSLGYSAFQEAGLVTDIGASVKIQRDIRITGIGILNPVNGALSNYEEYNVSSISSSLSLPNSNSKITYEVEVTNFGNAEMVLKDIEGLPDNLEYTIDPTNYSLNGLICDDLDSSKCTLGAQKTIYLTIGYVENGYDSSNTEYLLKLDFLFEAFDKVARIGTVYYQSLQDAMDDVPLTGVATTVILLKNTTENITINSGKNVVLDLQSYTLRNDGNDNVIKNYGILSISNGTITSNASTNGIINNYENATIDITGGRVIMTGGRQALYNDKGTANISGTAYLSSSASARAAVQQTSGSRMTITGGTIISSGSMALNNAGTLTIGTEGGGIDNSSPSFQSSATGEVGINSSTNFSFFDGIVKSKGNPFNDVSKITKMETGYGIVTSTETIDGVQYNVAHLGISVKVTFNANGGTVSESIRYVEVGHAIGTLPIPTRAAHDFDGWFTAASGGTQVTSSYIVNSAQPLYAHWTQTTGVAMIGATEYSTLGDAIAAAPANTLTTIQLMKDISEILTVGNTKNIILDLGGKTISNSGANPIFVNSGTLTLTNGTLSSNTTQGAINNTAGSLTIDGASIIATGNRQAIYITGGTVTITGDAYLSSKTSGKPSGSQMERGTVQVVSGTLIVESGTIIGVNQQAISNEGTVTVGTQGGTVSTTSPVLQGYVNGIKTTGTFNFYDGIIKGCTTPVNGTITNYESGYEPTSGSDETIGGKTYHTKYLTPIP